MAKYKKGILGSFRGTVGTVVGSVWRGINYMRSIADSRKDSNTPAQAVLRAKFAKVTAFHKSMKDLLEIGYKESAIYMTGANSALAYTLKSAITGVYPNFTIAYNMVKVSNGSLPNAVAPATAPGAAGIINYTWTNNSGIGIAFDTDKSLLVAYCEELNQTVYACGAVRSAGTGTLNVPAFSGKPVQTWISFVSANNRNIATSLFTGQVNVVSCCRLIINKKDCRTAGRQSFKTPVTPSKKI